LAIGCPSVDEIDGTWSTHEKCDYKYDFIRKPERRRLLGRPRSRWRKLLKWMLQWDKMWKLNL
jgi:hypothetical protein